MRTVIRLSLILLLLAATFGLAVHYGTSYSDNWPYPDTEAVADNPAEYDGETILFIGTVESVDADANEITYRPDRDLDLTLRATNFDAYVEPGGTVHVYGPLADEATVHHAESIVVVNETPGDSRYKLVMSGLGALLAAGLFLFYWRIDLRTLSFQDRDRHG